MIGIKLSGGLGNNMFEYASGKSLELKKNCIPYGMDRGEEVQKWNYVEFNQIKN